MTSAPEKSGAFFEPVSEPFEPHLNLESGSIFLIFHRIFDTRKSPEY